MPITRIIEKIVSHRNTRHCVTRVKHLAPKAAVLADFPSGLLPEMVAALKRNGVRSFIPIRPRL